MATLATAGRNAAVTAVAALLNSGDIQFQTTGNAEVATCTFASTAFGAANVGVCAAATIGSDTSAAGGTVAHAVLRTSAGATIITATTAVGSGDFNMTSLVIGANDIVAVSSLTLTQPA